MSQSEKERNVSPAPAPCRRPDVTRARLLQCIIQYPGDEVLRKRFACLIDDEEPERADFIRRQLALAGDEDLLDPMTAIRDHERAYELEKKNSRLWSGLECLKLPADTSWEFRRGFVEHLLCSGEAFREFGYRIIEHAPVRHLTIRTLGANFRELFEGSPINKMWSLSLDRCSLDEDFARQFAAQCWPDLVWLSLANNRIPIEGVLALARATVEGRLPELRYLDLSGYESDPREVLSWDQGVFVAAHLPNSGWNLIGELDDRVPRWLRLTDKCGEPLDTNRFRMVDRALSKIGSATPAIANA